MLLEEVEVRAPCDPSARAWSSSIILTAGDLALLLEGLDFKHLCLFGSQALRTGKSPVWPTQGQPPLLFTFPAWYFFFFLQYFPTQSFLSGTWILVLILGRSWDTERVWGNKTGGGQDPGGLAGGWGVPGRVFWKLTLCGCMQLRMAAEATSFAALTTLPLSEKCHIQENKALNHPGLPVIISKIQVVRKHLWTCNKM